MKIITNKIKETNKSYLTKTKKNNYYLDYGIRKNILLSYNPFKIISFKSFNELIIDAYLFCENEKIIVVIEQLSGKNYSKILFLNKNDDIVHIIKECIKNDKNKDIIRISHTTEENYENILNLIFCENDKKITR